MALSQADFEFIRTVVLEKAAIVLDNGKQYFVESRIEPLVANGPFETLTELLREVKTKPTSPHAQELVEAITIHETSFFRDMYPFKALKDLVVPDLLQKKGADNSLNIWCAACSSGQEPYSMAIMLRENFPQLQSWNVRFIATDISNQILSKAKDGRFTQLEVNRGLPAPLLLKYFEKQGLEWQIKPAIRSSIEFRHLNLITDWPPLPKMDIILLRNVLIYFDVPTKRAILGKVRDCINSDGYLFLGAAEMPMSIDNAFGRVDYNKSGCYRMKS